MNDSIFEKTEGNVTLKVLVDDSPLNPRTEYDNLGKILYTSSRYCLGDRQAEEEEIRSIMESDEYLWLPVYACIHSGTRLSTAEFGDKWDSGMSGIVYVSMPDALKEWSKKRLTPKLREAILGCLKTEVETFSQYLNGEVYGWVIEVDGGHVDSCWGFFGNPKELIEDNWANALQAGEETRKAAEVAVAKKKEAVKSVFNNTEIAWNVNEDGSATVRVDGKVFKVSVGEQEAR